MTKVDFFGHWFYFFLFVGMLLLQTKDYRGWAFRFAGELGWIGIGFVMGMSSIWAWGFAFLAVDVLGYFKWQKEQQELADLEREQEEWTKFGAESLDEIFPEDFTPDCTATEHQSFCREYVKQEFEKVKANGKDKTKQRKSEGKKMAAARRRTTNGKVRVGRGRRSKPTNGKRRGGSNDEPSRKKSVPRKRGM